MLSISTPFSLARSSGFFVVITFNEMPNCCRYSAIVDRGNVLQFVLLITCAGAHSCFFVCETERFVN